MALTDCDECWATPCECGHEWKGVSEERKKTMTKAINGFSIEDVFKWLADKDYLTDDYQLMYYEFIEDAKTNS